MQTPLVFKLSALALMGLSLGAFTTAQDAGDGDAPRPRLQVPRGFTSVSPSLGMFRAGETPRLGVMIDVSGDGIVVSEVQDDSLAAAAGVKAGDLLLSLDGQRLVGADDVGRALAGVQPGATFALTVVREGEGLVKLEATRPEPKVEKPAPVDGHRGAFLGVTLGDAADGGGVTLSSVQDGSAAWFATLEEGDVLTKVGDTAVNSAAEVASAVAAFEPGSVVSLSWTRDGEAHSNQVRLGHRGGAMRVLGNAGDMPGFVIPQGNARGGSFLFRNGQNGPGNALRFFHNGDDDDVQFDVHKLQQQLQNMPHKLQLHGIDGLDLDSLPRSQNFFSVDTGDGQVLDINKILKDAGVDLEQLKDGVHQLQIKLDGNKLEITTDGDVQVHELDDVDVDPASHVLYSFSTNSTAPSALGRVRGVAAQGPLLVTRGNGTVCTVTRTTSSECETECSAETKPDCAEECDVELVDELPVEPAAVSDHDLL